MGLLIHSPTDGQLDCFQLGSILSKAVVNCTVCTHFTLGFFFFFNSGWNSWQWAHQVPCLSLQTEELSFQTQVSFILKFFLENQMCFFGVKCYTYLRLPQFKLKSIPVNVTLARGKDKAWSAGDLAF